MKQTDLLLLKEFLDEKYFLYNHKKFIESDPICIPHQFTKKQDIEIAAFLAATIAWGNRQSIIKNAGKLMQFMDFEPHSFVTNATAKDIKVFSKFVHRTFNGDDCMFFIQSLKHLYKKNESLELLFSKGIKPSDETIKNSSSKRLCMFLRWMVRTDKAGVDFGIWKTIKPSQLCLPLDLHTGNVSRKLGLLKRTQNDWQAVEEVTALLRQLDNKDPVKYDFALFGLGVFEKFK